MYTSTYVYLYSCGFMCVWLRVAASTDLFVWSEFSNERLKFVPIMDPIHWRFENWSIGWSKDTLAIRRPIHRMIQRFVSIHAVKIKQQFGSKIASFHVSVCSISLSQFTIVSSVHMLPLLLHVTLYFILPVWLHVSLHESSMSVHIIYLVNLSDYQCHFMCI